MSNTTIIAEIGQNYCGDMDLAKRLIGLAKDNGASLVKFQLFDGLQLYGSHTEIELTFSQANTLLRWGNELGIEVFFSVFDIKRVGWCEQLGVKRYKVAARHGTNIPLRESIIATGKPIIQSMSPAVSHYYIPGAAYLYCVSVYPYCGKMPSNALDFRWWEGISDHTFGLESSFDAINAGSRIIEKHFALDHNTGIDAPWSMNPVELKELSKCAKS
jgi:sialic acid synthase SpsE